MSPTTTSTNPSPTPWHLSNGQTMEDVTEALRLRKIMGGAKVSYWVPPAWTDPHYKPPNSFTPTLVFCYACAVMGIAMVAFRIHTTQRTRPTRLLYLEDWLILLGLICLLALCALAVVGHYKWQFGWHSYDMHIHNLVWNYTFAYIWFIINLWATCIMRASLILTIRRIYSPLNTRLLRVCDVLLVCKVLVAISGTFGITFACGPGMSILNIWKFNPEQCNPYISMAVVCGVLLALDVIIIILPMPLVKMLSNVARKRRIEVLIIFSLGFLAIAASIIRLIEVIHYFHTLDKNWIASYVILTSLLDLTLALVTSCIPSARILFIRLYSERSLFSINAYFSRMASPEPGASVKRLQKRASTINAREVRLGKTQKDRRRGIRKFLSEDDPATSATGGTTVTTDTFRSSRGDFEKFNFELESARSPTPAGLRESTGHLGRHSRRGSRNDVLPSERRGSGNVPLTREPPTAFSFYRQKRQSLSSNVLPITGPPSLQEELSIRSLRNSGLGTTWFDDNDDEENGPVDDDDSFSSDGEDGGGGTGQYYEGDREFLIPCPSDSFFPYATALRPPPPRRS